VNEFVTHACQPWVAGYSYRSHLCSGAADVIDAVNYAQAKDLPLAVRCGGHSVAGNGTVDGGVLVDLASLKGVHVDPAARTARVNGGVLVGELDRETQLFGLATPSGRVTTTGVGGFTLGGGYGWLSPKFGLACDNLLSANVGDRRRPARHRQRTRGRRPALGPPWRE
jgi:FAD/FMN-containing dehydrogenase